MFTNEGGKIFQDRKEDYREETTCYDSLAGVCEAAWEKLHRPSQAEVLSLSHLLKQRILGELSQMHR